MALRRLGKTVPGQPGVPMLEPGPRASKKGIRRLIKRDESKGITMPEANEITETHIGIPPIRGARTLVKAATARPNAGRRVISAARARVRRR